MFCKRALFLLLCFCSLFTVQARDLFEVESQYSGNGSFQYQTRTLGDPFVKTITLYQIGLITFTNLVESTSPEHWTNIFNPDWSGIRFDETVVQPRTNEVTLLARSAATHFRKETNGFILLFGIEFTDQYIWSGVGFVRLDCLVPCSAEESDGSLPTLISRFEAVKDIKIDALVRTNNQTHGITFSWNEPSTVQLEGSHDLKNWNYVARFFGNAPQTTWITNVSLDSFGQFFRLSLIANRHLTTTFSKIAPDADASAYVSLKNCRVERGQFTAEFSSQINAVYQLELCNQSRETVQTDQVTASKDLTTVSFDLKTFPTGFVRVKKFAP